MDWSLNQYVEKVNKLQKTLNTATIFEATKILEQLETYVKTIQSVSYKIYILHNEYKNQMVEQKFNRDQLALDLLDSIMPAMSK